MKTAKRVAIALAVLAAAIFALVYFGDDHQRFLEFADRREAWHQKCDAYVNVSLSDPKAKACNDELQEMMAYAKNKGWH